MKYRLTLFTLSLAMAGALVAQETQQVNAPTAKPAASKESSQDKPRSAADEAAKTEQEALALQNGLDAERLKKETAAQRNEITKLKIERELLTERLALESTKRDVTDRSEQVKFEQEKAKIFRESELAKMRAENLSIELKAMQSQSALEITRLQNEIARIETAEKREHYADSKPEYLEKPLREDGVLVISDRRIPLNGAITEKTADFICDRIHYYNNKDHKQPIFIVIDSSPGGSVMAGYRILKAMESSDAPVHVVVKSFAASMAAGITTMAKESYAYPNAIILHHQLSKTLMSAKMNLTEQKELYEDSERWWQRLSAPVAAKMGISVDELVKRMYAKSTSGDWSEFADEAVKLKWVNHVVKGIEETSFVKDPDMKPAAGPTAEVTSETDAQGVPHAVLPRLSPKDAYFLYNPDGYYMVK